MDCKGCKFLDKRAAKAGKPACTYPFKLELDTAGNCLKKRKSETGKPTR